ncbi:hypothetical protein IH980_01490 [Patescibacteria group bacterium]|nr:hypothetical protein [Patescibacteria group bacterium]
MLDTLFAHGVAMLSTPFSGLVQFLLEPNPLIVLALLYTIAILLLKPLQRLTARIDLARIGERNYGPISGTRLQATAFTGILLMGVLLQEGEDEERFLLRIHWYVIVAGVLVILYAVFFGPLNVRRPTAAGAPSPIGTWIGIMVGIIIVIGIAGELIGFDSFLPPRGVNIIDHFTQEFAEPAAPR